MELQDRTYVKSEFIETASGNKVSRQSVLCGSQNIVLNGKTIIMSECIIRGDLANVRIGRHCVINKRSVIRPPFKKFSKGVWLIYATGIHPYKYLELPPGLKLIKVSPLKVSSKHVQNVAFFPLHIGDHVYIEEDCIVNAAQIGSHVYIGKNCIIGRRSVLKDCCVIADNTVLPPETVVPPFTLMAGSPAKAVAELPECAQENMADLTKGFYQHFLPIVDDKSKSSKSEHSSKSTKK